MKTTLKRRSRQQRLHDPLRPHPELLESRCPPSESLSMLVSFALSDSLADPIPELGFPQSAPPPKLTAVKLH